MGGRISISHAASLAQDAVSALHEAKELTYLQISAWCSMMYCCSTFRSSFLFLKGVFLHT